MDTEHVKALHELYDRMSSEYNVQIVFSDHAWNAPQVIPFKGRLMDKSGFVLAVMELQRAGVIINPQ